MTIKPGDKLPQAHFMTFGDNGPEPKSTDVLFSGKRVALFAVPGAFTPTCSAQHLPSFVEKAGELKSAGIDDIACVSVNDIFVMGAWGEQQEVGEAVTMLADGNGDFTKYVGLEMDGSGFGMGKRSQRYAMVVNDGVVEHLFVEGPGEYKVSSAEHMLAALKA